MWQKVKPDFFNGSIHCSVNRLVNNDNGLIVLRQLFPDGQADQLNFVLFSTSGVHGSYTSIEDEEALPDAENSDEYDADGNEVEVRYGVTFLVVHPREVALRYGVAFPKTPDDFEFLKRLRKSSSEAIQLIGY
ncbi:hypothetical protein [Methylovulum psychrotolerans]|uniref:Uncharacterized protein n=1 Tax=Methylovulum psychrotolerans TaxID=1704499 RepID=A0A2S5CGJ7_9GAMM|nr:hypothetical protein [Methylovulum psychrotolerans]POZ49887.1 hypothetical protein AADEFJLK_04333 [Methylovulum psychrotolerans]